MKRKQILYISLAFVVATAISSFVTHKIDETKTQETIASSASCSYNIKRLTGYNNIKPLLFVDNTCESENLASIKQDIFNQIEIYKKNGMLNSASVYLKEYNGNEWTSVNPDELYQPGSLLKVPELIAFLKMEEKNPGLLNKVISYDKPFEKIDKKPLFPASKSVQIGQQYTVRELLTYMIQYSDNNATLLLNNIIDVSIFQKVFTDLGLKAPDWKANSYPMTAADYSLFIRAIYNASYLSIKNSEFAAELLTQSDFKEGIKKGLPKNIKIAHKFGEAGNLTENQLHESALVLLDDRPYLLTIMTKGSDMTKLTEVIGQISSVVYRDMNTL